MKKNRIATIARVALSTLAVLAWTGVAQADVEAERYGASLVRVQAQRAGSWWQQRGVGLGLGSQGQHEGAVGAEAASARLRAGYGRGCGLYATSFHPPQRCGITGPGHTHDATSVNQASPRHGTHAVCRSYVASRVLRPQCLERQS